MWVSFCVVFCVGNADHIQANFEDDIVKQALEQVSSFGQLNFQQYGKREYTMSSVTSLSTTFALTGLHTLTLGGGTLGAGAGSSGLFAASRRLAPEARARVCG
jgi:hypothetical protein